MSEYQKRMLECFEKHGEIKYDAETNQYRWNNGEQVFLPLLLWCAFNRLLEAPRNKHKRVWRLSKYGAVKLKEWRLKDPPEEAAEAGA